MVITSVGKETWVVESHVVTKHERNQNSDENKRTKNTIAEV